MEIVTMVAALLACAFSLAALLRSRSGGGLQGEDLEKVRQDLLAELRQTRRELAEAQSRAAQTQDSHLREGLQHLAQQQNTLQRTVTDQLMLVNEQLKGTGLQSEQKLENIRQTVEQRLASLQADNNQQLAQMRQTVDEKLQKTLDDKLRQSFELVSSRLEAVYKGLGEMQTLAAGVGDLKKVLSNVKTRGILGEVQLGAILEQLLAPAQYEANVATVPGSSERVEYALRLPGDGENTVWMPIDAKFPLDAYNALLAAYDAADPAAVESAAKELDKRLRAFAKDIHDKYLAPPHTTDFGVMFLPVEGLYAEAVRRGITERLQREYKVVAAGPTTMAALLNSLQMGFRTLAIQKRSGEVWQVLGGVKGEFARFGQALAQTQARLDQASRELENLVGVRTRQMQRRLEALDKLDTGDEPVTLLPGGIPGQQNT